MVETLIMSLCLCVFQLEGYTLKTQLMDLQENWGVWWVMANKNAVDKAVKPSCALRNAASLRRGRIASRPVFGRGVGEDGSRTVNPNLAFLAIFPTYISLISNVWVV